MNERQAASRLQDGRGLLQCMSPKVAPRVNSRHRINSVAFGVKRTFSEPRLLERIYEYASSPSATTGCTDWGADWIKVKNPDGPAAARLIRWMNPAV
jgi:hypothetical protein